GGTGAVLWGGTGRVGGLGKRRAEVAASHLLALRYRVAPRPPGVRRSLGLGGARRRRRFETWLCRALRGPATGRLQCAIVDRGSYSHKRGDPCHRARWRQPPPSLSASIPCQQRLGCL